MECGKSMEGMRNNSQAKGIQAVSSHLGIEQMICDFLGYMSLEVGYTSIDIHEGSGWTIRMYATPRDRADKRCSTSRIDPAALSLIIFKTHKMTRVSVPFEGLLASGSKP